MKKWLFCGLLLAAIPVLSYGSFGGEDVGKLRPVQVVLLQSGEDGVQVVTDAGEMGSGVDISRALNDLKLTSSGEVFLDTADYLLLEPGMEICLPQLQEYLRPSCNLCYVSGDTDLEQVAAYLQNHVPKFTLTQYQAGERRLPYLISDKERLKLVQP